MTIAVAPRPKRGSGRRQLIASSLALIADRGLHAVRLREVAAHAGLALGSTTYHFTDRTTLIGNVLATHTDDFEGSIAAARARAAAAPNVPAALHELRAAVMACYTDREAVLVRAETYLDATRNDSNTELASRQRAALDALMTDIYVTAGDRDREQARSDGEVAIAVLDRRALSLAADDPNEFAATMGHHVAALTSP